MFMWHVLAAVSIWQFQLTVIDTMLAAGRTHHIMAPTSFMMISFRTLKKSNISLAFSPIFPMMTPKATKNPIRPGETRNTAMFQNGKWIDEA